MGSSFLFLIHSLRLSPAACIFFECGKQGCWTRNRMYPVLAIWWELLNSPGSNRSATDSTRLSQKRKGKLSSAEYHKDTFSDMKRNWNERQRGNKKPLMKWKTFILKCFLFFSYHIIIIFFQNLFPYPFINISFFSIYYICLWLERGRGRTCKPSHTRIKCNEKHKIWNFPYPSGA